MDTFPTAKPNDQHPTSENKLESIISDEILRSRIRKISSEPTEPTFERLKKPAGWRRFGFCLDVGSRDDIDGPLQAGST
jgi:hypothetical protein